MDSSRTYDDGMRDGKIQALEDMQISQNNRIEMHNKRLTTLEKTMYMMIGIVVFIQFAPQITRFFGG